MVAQQLHLFWTVFSDPWSFCGVRDPGLTPLTCHIQLNKFSGPWSFRTKFEPVNLPCASPSPSPHLPPMNNGRFCTDRPILYCWGFYAVRLIFCRVNGDKNMINGANTKYLIQHARYNPTIDLICVRTSRIGNGLTSHLHHCCHSKSRDCQ